jgi:hypothetical protein
MNSIPRVSFPPRGVVARPLDPLQRSDRGERRAAQGLLLSLGRSFHSLGVFARCPLQFNAREIRQLETAFFTFWRRSRRIGAVPQG